MEIVLKIVIANPLLALDAQFCIGKEETRYYLNGFYVQSAGESGGIFLVSTDGHRMTVIHDPAGSIEGSNGEIVKLPASFLKEIKPATKHLPKYATCTIEITGDVKSSTATITKSGDPLHIAVNVLINGTYPDWPRALPMIDHTKPFVSAPFNPAYYGDFGKLSRDREAFIAAYGNDKHGPHLVKVKGRDDVVGVLMPALERTTPLYPAWIRMDDKQILPKEKAA